MTTMMQTQHGIPYGSPQQQAVLYGHAGYESALPPMLAGEHLLPLELILLIRNGQRSLETEDQLINEILMLLDVCGGPKVECLDYPNGSDYARNAHLPEWKAPSPLYWRVPTWMPAPNSPEEAFVGVGWEILFKTSDGLPVRVSVPSVPYELRHELPSGRMKFVKEPPVVELPIARYRCPLTNPSSELRQRGYRPCAAPKFVNLASLYNHMEKNHIDARNDPLYDWKGIEAQVVEEAEREQAARRASDPRLHVEQPSPIGPHIPEE